MLKGNQEGTIYAIRELRKTVLSGEKPLVFWIGAGASKWCGYPLWAELAAEMHSHFLRYVPNYDKALACKLIEDKEFPKFFSLARIADENLYFRLLEKSLSARPRTSIYERFIEAMTAFGPQFILTTNFDNLLQAALNPIDVIAGDEIERVQSHIYAKKPFVCHIHGSADKLQSLVLTEKEYEQRIHDKKYQDSLRNIFSSCTVLFIGYGLGDQYVLEQLERSGELSGIIGSGPHFAVAHLDNQKLPKVIRQIQYHAAYHSDHRSAIFALESIKPQKEIGKSIWSECLG